MLLVAATLLESKIIRQTLKMTESAGLWQKGSIQLIHTRIGMINTAYALGQFFAGQKVEMAIQFGIAGSYSREFQLGDQVVEVVSECFPELGADSPAGYLGLEQMGFPLMELHGKAVYNVLENPTPSRSSIPKVRGLTVNRVSGQSAGIQQRYEQWPAEIETMEGAAFFHACLQSEVPFYQFRGLSNYVEPRNRSNWRIPEALASVQAFVLRFLEEMRILDLE